MGVKLLIFVKMRGMFNDDFWNDAENPDSIDELINTYQQIKEGTVVRYLEEEDYETLIEHFFQHNREAEALTACELAETYFPYSSSILLLKAEILFQGQKFRQALLVLDRIDGLEQNLLESVMLRSDIYLAQFKFDLAANFLEEKIPQFEGKERTELMLELSDVYDECESYDAVFDTLERILMLDPKNEEALHKISFWADFSGMHERSITLHKRLIEDTPYNALAWFNLGAAYQGIKAYEKAIDAYEYCVAIDEKFEFAYRNMADAYMRLEWYEKAIESLEKNLQLGKPEDVIFEAIGHCFEKQKDFQKARHYYRQAIELNPADDAIFFRIGETYMRERQWEKAVKSYSSALHLNKDNARYFLAMGHCLVEMNSAYEALLCFLNAFRLKPQMIGAWMGLIKGLIVNEQLEEALTQIQNGRKTLGDKPDFDYYQAVVLFARGKSKEALLFLEKALEKAPSKFKIVLEIQPEILQRKPVAQLVGKYKKKK